MPLFDLLTFDIFQPFRDHWDLFVLTIHSEPPPRGMFVESSKGSVSQFSYVFLLFISTSDLDIHDSSDSYIHDVVMTSLHFSSFRAFNV